jgi:hypothetical protein
MFKPPRISSPSVATGFAVLFGFISAARAATTNICVNPSGSNGCLKTIQAAINAATGDTVISIGKGTYSENLSIPAHASIELDGGSHTASDTSITAHSAGSSVISTGTAAKVTVKNLSLGGAGAPKGGGILAFGSLTLDNVIVSGNAATASGLAGGGLRYSSTFGKLIIRNSLFEDDVAAGSGGCLGINGNAKISNTSLIGCHSSGSDGGAIDIASGNVTLSNVTIESASAAGNGGGISIKAGKLVATNTSIVSNSAVGSGGAIFLAGGSAAMNNDSIGLNSAASGGGVANSAGAKSFKISNSIVAGNSATSAPDCAGNINSAGYNLFEDETGCTIGGTTTGNITGVGAMFGPIMCDLTNPVECALSILGGSPAVGAGNPGATNGAGNRCLAKDALGFKRLKGACDMGAFEYTFSA